MATDTHGLVGIRCPCEVPGELIGYWNMTTDICHRQFRPDNRHLTADNWQMRTGSWRHISNIRVYPWQSINK